MPTPEAQARERIDEQLIASGWIIQNLDILLKDDALENIANLHVRFPLRA